MSTGPRKSRKRKQQTVSPKRRKISRRRSPSNESQRSLERIHTSRICNLILPVPRIKNMLKVHNYAGRVSNKSAVFLTSVMEYITTEILELSSNVAREEGFKRIQPKHVNMALKTDPEFMINFRNSAVMNGGIIPMEHVVHALENRQLQERDVERVMNPPVSKRAPSKSKPVTKRGRSVKPRTPRAR